MKIAHVVYGMTIGGIETMLLNIANEQVKSQDLSIVVINDLIEPSLTAKLDSRINLIQIKRPVGSKSPYYLLKLNYTLLRIAPDIIHLHCSSMIRFLYFPLFRKKTCITQHSLLDSRYVKHISSFEHRYAISKSVQENIKLTTGKDSEVVMNGIPMNSIETKKSFLESKFFQVVILGRLEHQIKGQHIAIQALRILRDRGINQVRLSLIGEGESESYLKQLVIDEGLSETVTFLGLKSQDYIFSHLHTYDLLIQPSLYEGFGLTVAEAMAAKVPVLVSENDGPLEIIDYGKYGYSFKKNDPEDCARMIEQIMADPHKDKLVEEAYQRVKENYDVIVTANTYIEKYKEILSNRNL
ncbi:glycosyltransferase [Bacteroidales bacterium OttesenSCG-928-J19]|nr:glycosyltransferase [Bacteroidales bacterium OttesenSCG-928-J19]